MSDMSDMVVEVSVDTGGSPRDTPIPASTGGSSFYEDDALPKRAATSPVQSAETDVAEVVPPKPPKPVTGSNLTRDQIAQKIALRKGNYFSAKPAAQLKALAVRPKQDLHDIIESKAIGKTARCANYLGGIGTKKGFEKLKTKGQQKSGAANLVCSDPRPCA